MGGATVCLASSLDLPKQVVGIVSDCAYTSIKDELKYQMSKFSKYIPMNLLINVINLFIKARLHVSMNDTQPIDAVKDAKVPMIFYHGVNDEIVDVDFCKQLYEACGSKKKMVIDENANHAETIAYQKQNYINNILDFFNLR